MNKYIITFKDGFTDVLIGDTYKQAISHYNALRRIMIASWRYGLFNEPEWIAECEAYFKW